MKFKSFVVRISAVLAILMSLLLCLHVINNHSTSNATSQSTLIQDRHDMNQRTGNSNSPPGGQNDSLNHQNQIPNNGQFQPKGQMPSGQPISAMPGRRGTSTGSNYSVQIVAYAIAFFLAGLAAYFIFVRKKLEKKLKITNGNRKLLMITLFCVGFLLRIAVGILIEGHASDLSLFKSWATSAANNFSQFYSGQNSSDYPPLYIYVLYIVGKIGSLKALNPYFTVLLKFPSILADMGTALLLSKLARKYLSPGLSILVAAFYIFNPAVFVNSTIWGQVDSFFTLIVIAGIVLLAEQKLTYSSIFFTAAVLMKPQGIIFLPILFFELVKRRTFKDTVKVLIVSAATATLLILPFSSDLNVLWIVKLFTSTLGEYPYASVNAFNFFYLLGANYTKDASAFLLVSYHIWGTIFIVLTTLLAWFVFARGKGKDFVPATALILISGVFIFSTRMHERYLFPAVALAVLAWIYLKDKRIILLSAGFSITSFANTFYVLWQTNGGINQSALSFIPVVISALNVALFIYMLKTMYELSAKKSLFRKLQLTTGPSILS
ncbi:hypothetical protein [Desulfosporosinus sp. SB140]|uniref:hypothetical protein n=1 Tax=Desulfosporosinus paludis TaxID=3115649 RepID=UPI00388F4F61